ncbi:MAG: tRNA uridine(34) 5-carboxymethylaminomethyl modification radical SAM/GNAT enzyme Elp3 [Candidatus Woesearchaeota archaeon]
MNQNFFTEIIKLIIKKKPNKKQLVIEKTKLCRTYHLNKIPTDIEIMLHSPVKDIPKIRKFLLAKPTRTISGVAVCAIMTKPMPCPHGKCAYCPGGPKSAFGSVPQSYTGKEPATRRAIRNKYNAYLQVMNRLEQYVAASHVPDKLELIIMGGTFPSFPKSYQENFIKNAMQAMNDFSSLFIKNNNLNITKFKDFFQLPGDIADKKRTKDIHKKLLKIKNSKKTTLEKEQIKNEKAAIRCVGLTIETRPDYGKLEQANEMLRLGCTRVELGIQTVYDKVLEKIERGHSVKDSIESTRILKDLGFKINYHVMPGLPSVTKEQDLNSLKTLFKDENFRPDMLKIYPCMVMKGTKLFEDWKKGNFKPLTTEKAASLIAEFKKYIPEYVRIMRVQRDIPTFMTESGIDRTNLRQYVEKICKEKDIKCRCIRCREAGIRNLNLKNLRIKIIEYKASKGKEFFIAAEDEKNDILFGYCRLRFPSQLLRQEITKNSSVIRELHIYSTAVSIGKKSKQSFQHRGIGKKLMKIAEQITKKHNKNKVVVISGIGAKQYFAKLGYKHDGPYMSKILH